VSIVREHIISFLLFLSIAFYLSTLVVRHYYAYRARKANKQEVFDLVDQVSRAREKRRRIESDRARAERLRKLQRKG